MFVVGVDGCRDGWVVVALENGAFAGATKVDSFDDVLAVSEGAHSIGVDMPVGLVERGERTCDRLVREYIGPRRASVFVAPPRKALQKPTFEEANAECRKRAGFGLSKQLWNIRPKILEVDSALRAVSGARRDGYVHHGRDAADPARLRRFARIVVPDRESVAPSPQPPSQRVVEVHPEASFREMAGAPLGANKKSYDGLMMRLELLEKGGIFLPKKLSIGRVAVDDVLDAAAAAWTANRYAEGRAKSLPEPNAFQHDGARIIAIWI
jgi:predicted RNase H-like nuclease